ncbi:MAG: CotH kinase family protein [Bacteroidaceae bacterium]|nr:CotH kinase family protein [Bacteroidaceae bacterium]
MKRKLLLTMSVLFIALLADAQEWMKVYRNYANEAWAIPLQIGQFSEFEFVDDETTLRGYTLKKDSTELLVPFSVEYLDSITFANGLTDEEKGHNRYRVFTLHVTTEGEAPIVEKETWIPCYFSLDGKGEYSDYSGTGRIRGRGNSSWKYYKKKPYKFKLDTKSKLLGLDKAKNWNLLSNYRDVTDMMNVFAFETARWMGMPNTNHTRFVEVFLNGEYVGVYQLTEKIEIGKNRVNIDEVGGVLMSFDKDDGPELSPEATDNFWSEVYSLPMCVKEPEDLSTAKMDSIREDFAVLERAVQSRDYALVDSLMDIPSFISILQLHEFLYNVEIDAPRSLYMYKDKGGKYTFGPVWDWDAAYDFDWSNWTENHTYFSDYKELIYGKDPVKATGASYHINKFFRDMFGCKEFVAQYKKAWSDVSDSIYVRNWAEIQKYIDEMNKGAYDRDVKAWPLEMTTGGWWGWGGETTTFVPSEEVEKMKTWLQRRKNYLDGIIANYPEEEEEVVTIEAPVVTVKDGAIYVTATMDFSGGYSQGYRININESDVTGLLGGNPSSLQPLDADGEVGWNTAAGRYGAWFDEYGDTNEWGWSHVYIESDELYSWKYGCHPDNCKAGDKHTVTMQYQRGSKTVNVIVTFTIK